MPYALKEAGFYGGMALILIVACCSDYTVRKIVALGVRAKRKYYEDLCASQFGHSGYVFVVGAMGIFAYGAMVAYLMGIGDNMSIVVSSWSGTDLHANPWIKRVTLSVISLGAVLPLALLRNMSALSKTSALSISAVLFIILVVLKNATFGAGDAPVPVKESDKALLLIDSNFFPAVGVIAFAFVCHHACFIVYNTLRDNTEARWAKTVHATLGVATSVMFVLAVGAFITFRGLTKGSFLTNYSYTDPLCNIMRCLFAVAQTLTYPLELFVARHATHALMFPAQKWTNEQHYTITLLLWGCVEAVRARQHVMPCCRLTFLRPVFPLPAQLELGHRAQRGGPWRRVGAHGRRRGRLDWLHHAGPAALQDAPDARLPHLAQQAGQARRGLRGVRLLLLHHGPRRARHVLHGRHDGRPPDALWRRAARRLRWDRPGGQRRQRRDWRWRLGTKVGVLASARWCLLFAKPRQLVRAPLTPPAQCRAGRTSQHRRR